MSTYLTLQQISTDLQSALLHSRTEFLLQQTELWQEINEAGKESNAFVKPSNLDLGMTKFEFYIVQKSPSMILNFFYSLFKISRTKGLFRLCNKNTEKSIKVTLEINVQSAKQLNSKVATEPKLDLKPENIYVSGITV
jgi:hypothetical protein